VGILDYWVLPGFGSGFGSKTWRKPGVDCWVIGFGNRPQRTLKAQKLQHKCRRIPILSPRAPKRGFKNTENRHKNITLAKVMFSMSKLGLKTRPREPSRLKNGSISVPEFQFEVPGHQKETSAKQKLATKTLPYLR